MDSTAAPKQGMLRDWGYYSLRWGLIFAILSGIMYKDVPQDQLWMATLQQAMIGLAFGLACAFVYTLAQNRFNKERGKVKNWIFAIVIWMAMKFVWFFAAGGAV